VSRDHPHGLSRRALLALAGVAATLACGAPPAVSPTAAQDTPVPIRPAPEPTKELVPASPTVAPGDAVDAYLRDEMRGRGIPGLAVAVVRHGAVAKLQAYGVASVELGAPVTPDTVFDLSSVTKLFTAFAVMLLAEDGKVALDDRVGAHVPNTPAAWDGITLRHLLTHTAGFPRWGTVYDAPGARAGRLSYTAAEMLENATKDALVTAPGWGYQYSNTGYFLLGLVVESAGKRRYGEFLTERFFRPLGMAATSFREPGAVVKDRAAVYTQRGPDLARLVARDTYYGMPSAGGLQSSARDLAAWDAALSGGKVLPTASLERMWAPVALADGSRRPQGLGWLLGERNGHREVWHAGATGTEYTRYPDDGLTVIVLTNLGNHMEPDETGNAWGLTVGVAGRYIPDLLVRPTAVPAPTSATGSSGTSGISAGALHESPVKPAP
jgi:D-alanyl-D-alanine carboxypeptidase